jgi:alkaline phosphatase D
VTRRNNGVQAFFEWLPIRETAGVRTPIYRHFAFGTLMDLFMLDTRLAGRDEQADHPLDDPSVRAAGRQLLGAGQERWLLDQLTASTKRGTSWRMLGQQVMFGQLKVPPGEPITIVIDQRESVPGNVDQWDGYPVARQTILDHIEDGNIDNVVVLTGDIHSSWGMEISRTPYLASVYDPETSRGSLAVEFVTPAVTSPALAQIDVAAKSEEGLYRTQPHLRYVDLYHRGYLLLDITAERTQAEWYFVPTVSQRTDQERLDQVLQTKSGSNRLEAAEAPSVPKLDAPLLAP